MALAPGTRLGPYEIGAQIGVGGMGEVYRAKDTNLGRDVAIKVLPDAFAQDSDRLARFEREAKTLASLNHPNIAIIHGFEKADGIRALVMELVEGPTLADRIAEGPIPLDEALPIAKQIAEAVETAHEAGIIHRDLKPANAKVRTDGTVKVLDFGLAKALEPVGVISRDATAWPTISSPALMTGVGVLLGTAAYMSPEQARGQAVDKRTDIWAFGCVLFEMLTGRHPFWGEDVTETLHAVIHTDPAWSWLPAATPQYVRVLLRRCLQKDPKRRLPHIGIGRLEIDEGLAATASGLTSTLMSVRSQRFPANVVVASAVAAASAAAVFALAFVMLPPRPVGDTQVTRASLLPPPDATWASVPPATRFTLSPDGRFLAFLATSRDGRTRLWLRALDALTARPLPGTDGALVATWSPDSRFLAFSAGGKLRKVDVSGGPPITLADMSSNNGITWSADDVILFPPDPAAGIFRVPSSGGTAARVTTLDAASGDARHWQPFFLPDNRRFLYHAVGTTTSPNEARAIFVGSLNPTEKGREILRGGSNAQYASGYLLFMRDTTLMAQRFNIQRLELFGEPLPVAEHIQIGGTSGRTGAFSVSRAGALVYQTGGPVEFRSQLEWFDRTGGRIGVLAGR